jgi:hypothetical protein
MCNRSQDSSVTIATRLDEWVSIPSRIFLFAAASGLSLGPTQPPSQCVPQAITPGVRLLGCEAYHSPPTSAEVKNVWNCPSTPPYIFMV